jgi:hypothetical protein
MEIALTYLFIVAVLRTIKRPRVYFHSLYLGKLTSHRSKHAVSDQLSTTVRTDHRLPSTPTAFAFSSFPRRHSRTSLIAIYPATATPATRMKRTAGIAKMCTNPSTNPFTCSPVTPAACGR